MDGRKIKKNTKVLEIIADTLYAGYGPTISEYQKGETAMNSAISSVIRNHTSNPATANKLESETIKSAAEMSGGQNNAVESSVSSKYDTLDLSREYIKYKTLSQNSALNDQTSQLNSTVIRQLMIDRNNEEKEKEEKEKEEKEEEEEEKAEKEEEKNEEPVCWPRL